MKSIEQIKITLLIGFLTTFTGCTGFGGGGYYSGGGIIVQDYPDMYFFSGEYYRGQEERKYSHRGSESRRVAHPSGGHDGTRNRGASHPSNSRGK